MFNKKITSDELKELNELWRIAFSENFKLECVRKNTLAVPGGQEYVKRLEGTAPLYSREFNDYVKMLLLKYGFKENEVGSIELSSGKIKKVK